MIARCTLLVMPLLACLVSGCGAIPSAAPAPEMAGNGDPTAPARPVATAASASALPNTPAGNQLNAWLQAFNTGDREAVGRFISEHVDPSSLAQFPVGERIFTTMKLYNATR